MGAHNRSASEPSQVTVTATNFIQHSEYAAFSLTNDISLIQFDAPITFTRKLTWPIDTLLEKFLN